MIVVFGSSNVDTFYFVDHTPTENEILYVDRHQRAIGGKGINQAFAAAKAGAQVRFFGCVGRDDDGRFVASCLKDVGIDPRDLTLVDTPTSSVANLKASNHQTTVVSRGANLLLRQNQVPDEALTDKTLLLLQGLAKMTENEELIRRTKAAGGRVMMNFAPANQKVSAEAMGLLDYFIVNEPEAVAIAKFLDLPGDDFNSLARSIAKQFNLTCVITLGGKGSVACEAHAPETLLFIPSLKVEVVDTVGAGDSFIGFMAASLDKGMTFAEALRRGSIAGSLACTKLGAQTGVPTVVEVESYLPNMPLPKAS